MIERASGRRAGSGPDGTPPSPFQAISSPGSRAPVTDPARHPPAFPIARLPFRSSPLTELERGKDYRLARPQTKPFVFVGSQVPQIKCTCRARACYYIVS